MQLIVCINKRDKKWDIIVPKMSLFFMNVNFQKIVIHAENFSTSMLLID